MRIDGEPYFQLPYIAPNQNYTNDVDDGEFLRATLMVNGKSVLDHGMYWNFFNMEDMIGKVLQGNQLETFAVKNLVCISMVANEMLDLIASQDISEVDGLSEIVLS